jgi:thioredoxin reductase (NADPH)
VTAHELVIVGAGPAGISAALWARSHEIPPLVLEGEPGPGGQLLHVYFEPRDLAGMPPGDGTAIATRYQKQLADSGVVVRYGAQVTSLAVAPRLLLTLAGGEELSPRAVLVATGARRRRLGVPGERELEDRGVSFSATRDRERLAGRAVAVVGGGDAAAENALLLAAAGCDVTLIARATLRARPVFRERVAADPRVKVLVHTRVVRVLGETQVTGLELGSPTGPSRLACDAVVIKVGVVPNTEWCRDAIPHDGEGYLRVDAALATGVPGVWAAGDVVRPAVLSAAVAVGQGVLAAAAIRAALKS